VADSGRQLSFSDAPGTDDVITALADYLTADSSLKRRLRGVTELSDTAWTALLALQSAARQDRTVSPKELAETLELRSASVTTLVDKLVRRGLVDRAPSTADRRGFILSLTEQGEAFVQEHDVARDAESVVIARLSADDARLLARFFGDLAQVTLAAAPSGTVPRPAAPRASGSAVAAAPPAES
jgi:DNA-binding MarR family transcriptional regulator